MLYVMTLDKYYQLFIVCVSLNIDVSPEAIRKLVVYCVAMTTVVLSMDCWLKNKH